MNKLQKALSAGALCLSLLGCAHEYKTGIVIKEKLFEPRNILEETEYVLQIKTNDKEVYTVSVEQNSNSGNTINQLETAIEEGTKIKFLTKNLLGYDLFGKDKIGKLSTESIEILKL